MRVLTQVYKNTILHFNESLKLLTGAHKNTKQSEVFFVSDSLDWVKIGGKFCLVQPDSFKRLYQLPPNLAL